MRAILFGSLGNGKTVVDHFLPSPDTEAMVAAMRLFGAKIAIEDKKMVIEGLEGQLKPCEDVIDAGNSGQVLRFVGSLAALLPTYTVITGDASIRHNRPALPLISALTQLGAFAVSTRGDGGAPLVIKGPLKPGSACFSGADSQPVSGLLIATSFVSGTTELLVTDPGEKPWIDLTLHWLERLGGRVSNENYERYRVTGPLNYSGFTFTVPGDWSAAAFPLAAALVTRSELTLHNIDFSGTQGDQKIVSILEEMGAQLIREPSSKKITILPSNQLEGVCIDANAIIDAIPILAVIACFAKGKTTIVNGEVARHKESDRISAITQELRKMGAEIEERRDGLTITPKALTGASLDSHSDHRIAMALAVASLAASGESQISGAGCIRKSYPHFVKDFQALGAKIDG